jgi:hypothetical protein
LVHTHAAYECALSLFQTDVSEEVGRFEVDGSVVGTGRRSVGEGPRDEVVIDAGSGFGVGERGFYGEGVGFEPGEECGFAEEAGVGVLGGVGVGVW